MTTRMLRLQVGGHRAYLEPDVVAFQVAASSTSSRSSRSRVIDGQADEESVAAAALQAAAYILALQDLLTAESLPAGSGLHRRHPGHAGELHPPAPRPPSSTCASRSASCAASWPA